jgi:hypothetical protein
MAPSSFLQIALQADNFEISLTDTLSRVLQSPVDKNGSASLRPWSIPLHLTRDDMQAESAPIGWLRPEVRRFLEYYWPTEDLGEQMIEFGICRALQRDNTEGNCWQDGPEFAFISERLQKGGYETITREMNRLAKYMKGKGMFAECLDGRWYAILTVFAIISSLDAQVGAMNIMRFMLVLNQATFIPEALVNLLRAPCQF